MRRIILDVDTGHDDAIAIAMAAGLGEYVEIEGIIVCAGNQTREKTLENTLNLAEALEIGAPVFAGASGPLLRERVVAGNIHGESGFDGPVFPPQRKKECKGNGITWALDKVLSSPGEITYVSVGPWTDLATCIKADERFAPSLKEIVLMGGAVNTYGNVTPSAEFNVYADPEAAAIVLTSGAPITMMGLDVTLKVLLTDEIMEKVRKLPPSRYRDIFLASMAFYSESIKKVAGEMPAMHDPCTIAYLADPGIFTFEKRRVTVETRGWYTYGKTTGSVVDEESNVKFGIAADTERFWELFFLAVSRLP